MTQIKGFKLVGLLVLRQHKVKVMENSILLNVTVQKTDVINTYFN